MLEFEYKGLDRVNMCGKFYSSQHDHLDTIKGEST